MEQKELNKKIKQAEKRVSELEQHVNDLENQINYIEQQLAQGGEVDPDIYNRHSQLNAELEQTMTQWEDAGEELEKIKQAIFIIGLVINNDNDSRKSC